MRGKNAWLVTGGTDVGVMRMVGELFQESRATSVVPLIGIATLGIVAERFSHLDVCMSIFVCFDVALMFS